MNETEMYRRIIALLASHGIRYEKFEHDFVHTSHDAAKVRGTDLKEAAKALVLETGSGKLFMCVVSGHRRLDLRKIKPLLGETNVFLAHPDKVLSATGCPVGSVPPFGNLFDPQIPVYVDKDVLSREHLVFSAGSHHHSIRMRSDQWVDVVQPNVAELGKDTP